MRVRFSLFSAIVVAALLGTGVGVATPAAAGPSVPPPTPAAFTPVTPVRVLDTRVGIGGVAAPLHAQEVRILNLSSVLPASATAVVLNLTGTNVTDHTFVTAWADGDARPAASNLNLVPGDELPDLVTVALGPARQIDLYNNSGSTDLVADVEGFYLVGPGSGFTPVAPMRVLDTRNGVGGPTTPLFAGTVRTLDLSGILPPGTSAVVFNLTGTNVTDHTYVTAWPDGAARPTASNLNLTPGQTLPNLVTVAVGPNRVIDLFNHVGAVDLMADLAGFYQVGVGSGFTVIAPQRVLDTRSTTPFGPGAIRVMDLSGAVPPTTSGVVVTLTGTNVTGTTYVTAWPNGIQQPVASNLNLLPGRALSNLAAVAVGPDRAVRLYNNAGNTDLIADLAGYFSGPVP